jgi:hypothetical protein
LWRDGEHEELHFAGRDLTDEFSGAPHGDEVFERFELVGQLEEEDETVTGEGDESSTDKPSAIAFLDSHKETLRHWYQKFHPHPMTVHFPIALHFFAGGVDLMQVLSLVAIFHFSHKYEITDIP